MKGLWGENAVDTAGVHRQCEAMNKWMIFWRQTGEWHCGG